MLPKEQRIDRKTFNVVQKQGKNLFLPFFNVRYIKKSAGVSQFSCVVSKKIAKSAVRRNKLRRWVYSSIRENSLSKIKLVIMIIYLKKEVIGASYEELNKEIIKLFESF